LAIAAPQSSLPPDLDEPYPVKRLYAWTVFAMAFGLMVSDYLSRQVINVLFPFLKADWHLSDTELGSLASVVALVVGIMTVPISFIADRIGLVKSITLMALIWALATIACGFSANFTMLLIARAFVGLGEAGYGSAGSAILAKVFPARLHATVMGAFLAAGMIGAVLGVVLGGLLAKYLGWKMSFIVIGLFGLALAISFPFVVKEPPRTAPAGEPRPSFRVVFSLLFAKRTTIFTCLGVGLGMFLQGAYLAWMPSFLNRYHGLEPSKAALSTGLLVVCTSIGMIGGGILVDRLSRKNRLNRLRLSAIYCLGSALVLFLAFSLPAGTLQFFLIGSGLMLSAGFSGPSSAVVADLTPSSIHATSFAVVAMCYTLLGMAPGPVVTGWLGDQIGLQNAMMMVPIVSVIASGFYFLALKHYAADRASFHGE
jgi:MFS family permease